MQRVRAWFNRLPPVERDLPIVILDGLAYTPRAILMEVERGSPIGERLQVLVESGRIGTAYSEEIALLKLRLKELLSRYPMDEPLVATIGELPGRAYTPRDLIREIEIGTSVGLQWVEAERRHVLRLLSLALR